LQRLDAHASCRIANLDRKQSFTCSGSELAHTGLEATLPDKPGSALLIYERQ